MDCAAFVGQLGLGGYGAVRLLAELRAELQQACDGGGGGAAVEALTGSGGSAGPDLRLSPLQRLFRAAGAAEAVARGSISLREALAARDGLGLTLRRHQLAEAWRLLPADNAGQVGWAVIEAALAPQYGEAVTRKARAAMAAAAGALRTDIIELFQEFAKGEVMTKPELEECLHALQVQLSAAELEGLCAVLDGGRPGSPGIPLAVFATALGETDVPIRQPCPNVL